jgi:hypothetical protein
MSEILVRNEVAKQELENKNKRKAEVIQLVAEGHVSTVEELATALSLPLEGAISLLDDPVIVQAIAQYGRTKSNLFFHTKGVNRLEQIAQSEDDKSALSAIKLIAQISNNLKAGSGTDVNVNISLESLVQAKEEKNVTPKHSPIIDLKH